MKPPHPQSDDGADLSEQPWYQDGLKFKCTQCGDCCTGAPGFVWVNQAEIAELSSLVGMQIPEFESTYVRKVGVRKSLIEHDNGDCVFFDGQARQCTVYGARPRQCRTWPFWHSNLVNEESWKSTCEVCPGAGHGNLIPIEEIQRQVKVLRL